MFTYTRTYRHPRFHHVDGNAGMNGSPRTLRVLHRCAAYIAERPGSMYFPALMSLIRDYRAAGMEWGFIDEELDLAWGESYRLMRTYGSVHPKFTDYGYGI